MSYSHFASDLLVAHLALDKLVAKSTNLHLG
jgi:hypothetical protein